MKRAIDAVFSQQHGVCKSFIFQKQFCQRFNPVAPAVKRRAAIGL